MFTPNREQELELSDVLAPFAVATAAALIALYVVQLQLGGTQEFLPHAGARHPGTLHSGAVWTLASASLVHIGWMHVLPNAVFVALMGSCVENVVGGARMLAIFLVGCLIGQVVGSLSDPSTIHASASGGCWALLTATCLLVLFPSARDGKPIAWNRVHIGVAVAANVFNLANLHSASYVYIAGLFGGFAVLMLGRQQFLWRVVAIVLVAVHFGGWAVALSVGKPWQGWPPLEESRSRVLANQFHIEIPQNLDVVWDEWRAGEIWWDGMATFYTYSSHTDAQSYLAQTYSHFGVYHSAYEPCTPSCTFSVWDYYGGTLFVTQQRVGPNDLITLVAVQDTASSAHHAWARQAGLTTTFVGSAARLAQVQFMRIEFPDAAVSLLEQLMEDHPDWPPVANILAWQLATHPSADHRDGSRALKLAQTAARRAPDDAATLDTLAAAYAEVGQFDDAIRVQTSTIEAHPDVAYLREHLFQFEKGNPIRDTSPYSGAGPR